MSKNDRVKEDTDRIFLEAKSQYRDHDKHFIKNAFTYRPPTEKQIEKYALLRSSAKEIANQINCFCPTSLEKDLALERLREAIMWANASIACNE